MMIIRSFLIGALFGAGSLIAENHLKKVFFHQGIFADKLVFYCLSQPVMQAYTKKDKGMLSYVGEFLSMKNDEPSCQERIDALNEMQKKKAKSATTPYSIFFNCHTKPVPTVLVTISYRPAEIELLVREFKSISGQPAIAFLLVRKKALATYMNEQIGSRWFNLKDIAKHRKIRVVIDAGHGGADGGAHGKAGVLEKDITLKMSQLLAQELRNRACEVRLTRTADVYVPLDERTTLTNLITGADLFISLHGNANTNPSVHGIETYFLTSPQEQHAIDQLSASFSRHGKLLAQNLQSCLVNELQKAGFAIKDRGVKNAVSQVLMVEAPAALVELDFLTHEPAAHRLNDISYQKKCAAALADGVMAYIGQA